MKRVRRDQLILLLKIRKFYGFTEIKNNSDIDHLELFGGGGTDFEVAVKAFTPDVHNKFIFTDGWADSPKEDGKNKNIIWLVYENREFKTNCGKVIFLTNKDLELIEKQSLTNNRNR